MADYVIITDSGCDLCEDQLKELEVALLPITFNLNGEPHKSYPVSKFYSELKAGASVSTSALNPSEIEDCMTPFLKEGKDVLYITFSSGLSSICQNAIIVANELKEEYPDRKIEVVDSLCASCGQGLLVYLSAMKRKAGASIDEVVSYANTVKHKICHEFTVDDLGQLKRGGRISSAAAFFGSMLQIKPVLYVSADGKLVPRGKVRGRTAAINALKNKVFDVISEDSDEPIFISHGDCEDDANILMDMVKEKFPERQYFINPIGPVIGSHSGYKTLAIFCIAKDEAVAK
jgi:DegV family protein with EDD domain